MKQTLLIILLSYSITWSQVYMNIKNKNGTTQTFSIENIRKLTFSGVVNVEDGEKLAAAIKTFTLLQNYPNPFNPSTTIEYQIPESGNIEVNIYDISGQLVKSLENNYQKAGSYKVSWDSRNNGGQNVASGIYLIQVKYNQTALTKKLIFIK